MRQIVVSIAIGIWAALLFLAVGMWDETPSTATPRQPNAAQIKTFVNTICEQLPSGCQR